MKTVFSRQWQLAERRLSGAEIEVGCSMFQVESLRLRTTINK